MERFNRLEALKEAGAPTVDQVHEDNSHFGPVIRIVEGIQPYDGQFDNFKYTITVGARNSVIKAFLDGERDQYVDAWATYLWDKNKKAWCLGAN